MAMANDSANSSSANSSSADGIGSVTILMASDSLEEMFLKYVARGNISNTSVAYLAYENQTARSLLSYSFIAITAVSCTLNAGLLAYILYRRSFRNFVSQHFIAHLMLINVITCCYAVPMFIWSVQYGMSPFGYSFDMLCQLHAFVFCCLWTVTFYMIACIAGVHYITFARIHYDQLFGLSPSIICAVAWLSGMALGLPCITNKGIVSYNNDFLHCLFQTEKSIFSYKFLAYLMLLGILLPIALTYYAYIRILAIFYHAPIVFEALGLFRSRYLIFAILLMMLCQVPFYILYLGNFMIPSPTNWPVFPVMMLLCYGPSLISPLLYGTSLILMKEEDIALTHRANRPPTARPMQHAQHTAANVPLISGANERTPVGGGGFHV